VAEIIDLNDGRRRASSSRSVKPRRLPWFKVYPGELLLAHHEMNATEFGCHMRLIMTAWRYGNEQGQDPSLPDDDAKLASCVGMKPSIWIARAKTEVMRQWQLGTDGRWRCAWLTDEYRRVENRGRVSRTGADLNRTQNGPKPDPTPSQPIEIPSAGFTESESDIELVPTTDLLTQVGKQRHITAQEYWKLPGKRIRLYDAIKSVGVTVDGEIKRFCARPFNQGAHSVEDWDRRLDRWIANMRTELCALPRRFDGQMP
jgi:Protein of unknown function (DUF1376)